MTAATAQTVTPDQANASQVRPRRVRGRVRDGDPHWVSGMFVALLRELWPDVDTAPWAHLGPRT